MCNTMNALEICTDTLNFMTEEETRIAMKACRFLILFVFYVRN